MDDLRVPAQRLNHASVLMVYVATHPWCHIVPLSRSTSTSVPLVDSNINLSISIRRSPQRLDHHGDASRLPGEDVEESFRYHRQSETCATEPHSGAQ